MLVCCLFVAASLSNTPASAAQLPDFTEIVDANAPAVVRIEIEQRARQGRGQGQLPEGIPEGLRRFFEGGGNQPPRARQSLGSGFFISSDGYVVTNNHVVEGADNVIVRMSDRREFTAEIIGTDPRSDLALLKVDAENLPVLNLGKPDELKVGEWVLAMGSPFGLDYSVSAGIVSAKGRSLPTENNENYVPFIQTDVAINPGNSGGPLFNLEGEVVGVNSQIYTRSGGSIGLSFAIPVSVVHNVVAQLKSGGEVSRGWLGVSIQDVDTNLAESFGLDKPRGALIAAVQNGGPAQEAGLLVGDIIVQFNGSDILRSADLPHVVGLTTPGSDAEVFVVRDRKRKKLTIRVGSLNSDNAGAVASVDSPSAEGERLGLKVGELEENVQSQWGISGGVVVREVTQGSAAEDAGIQPGDVITLVNSSPIASVAAFTRAVEELPAGTSVPLRVIRRGTPLFVPIRVPADG
jgi:serine protease Do